MKTTLSKSTCVLALAACALGLAGCATSEINPARARANTGYVDLHAKLSPDLSWEVALFDERAQDFRRLVSDWEPPKNGILRLELAPGSHRLRVACLNRNTTGPIEFPIAVEDAKITPVRVTFTKAGTSLVETEETSTGGTVYGRYGRSTKITGTEEVRYQLSATAEAPVTYQQKAQMPYAR